MRVFGGYCPCLGKENMEMENDIYRAIAGILNQPRSAKTERDGTGFSYPLSSAQTSPPIQTYGRRLTLRDLVLRPQTQNPPQVTSLPAMQSSPRNPVAPEQHILDRRRRDLARLRGKQKEGLSSLEAMSALQIIRDQAVDEIRTGSHVEFQEVVAKRHEFDLDELHSISSDKTEMFFVR